jgi:hypothetical protein
VTLTSADIFEIHLNDTELEEGCSAREMMDDLIHLVKQSAENLAVCHSGFGETDPEVIRKESGQLRIAVGGFSRILKEYEAEK